LLEEEQRTLTNKTNEKQGKGKTPRATQAARQNSETEKALSCAAAKDKKENRQRKGDDFTWSKHRRKEKHHSS